MTYKDVKLMKKLLGFLDKNNQLIDSRVSAVECRAFCLFEEFEERAEFNLDHVTLRLIVLNFIPSHSVSYEISHKKIFRYEASNSFGASVTSF